MIDLNAAMVDLETVGRVRLYHAENADIWCCAVHPNDYGSKADLWGTAETPEGAIRACVAHKANLAARERLGAILARYAPRGWGR